MNHYHSVMDQLSFSDLILLKNQIWDQLICRKMEYHLLKTSSLVNINRILYHNLHLEIIAIDNIQEDINK